MDEQLKTGIPLLDNTPENEWDNLQKRLAERIQQDPTFVTRWNSRMAQPNEQFVARTQMEIRDVDWAELSNENLGEITVFELKARYNETINKV